jgi:hypothetical protein
LKNKLIYLPGTAVNKFTHCKLIVNRESSGSSRSFVIIAFATACAFIASTHLTFTFAFDLDPSTFSWGPFAFVASTLVAFAFVAPPSFTAVARETSILVLPCHHFMAYPLKLAIMVPLVAIQREPELPLGQPLVPLVVVLRPL